jgi:hypothetical protein
MAGFSPFELQKSIYQTLSGDAALSAMITGVYDRVPQNTAFPYITIGETTGRDWSSRTTTGMNLVVTLHVFSRAGGRQEALQIMERIHALLHEGDLEMTDQVLIMMRFEMSDVLLEQDGFTYQGVIRFQALTEAMA